MDNKTLAALARLNHDTDFTIFMNWLAKKRAEQNVLLRDSPDTVNVFRAQGAVKFSDDIIEKVNTAQQTLERSR